MSVLSLSLWSVSDTPSTRQVCTCIVETVARRYRAVSRIGDKSLFTTEVFVEAADGAILQQPAGRYARGLLPLDSGLV